MKLNNKLFKENKAITLVALVITIVILLILAGISIAQLTGNGLFENAKLAKEKSENAQKLEDDTLGDYESKIGEYIDGTRNENAENYSQNETEIGTWIDGKKLYRKVYIQSTSNPIDISHLNYDYIQVSSRIYFKYIPDNNYYWRETYCVNATNMFMEYINYTTNTLVYAVGSNMVAEKIITIVEYTKNG